MTNLFQAVITEKGLGTWEVGAPGVSRTRDPLLRRQMLYPSELRAQPDHFNALEILRKFQLSGVGFGAYLRNGIRFNPVLKAMRTVWKILVVLFIVAGGAF